MSSTPSPNNRSQEESKSTNYSFFSKSEKIIKTPLGPTANKAISNDIELSQYMTSVFKGTGLSFLTFLAGGSLIPFLGLPLSSATLCLGGFISSLATLSCVMLMSPKNIQVKTKNGAIKTVQINSWPRKLAFGAFLVSVSAMSSPLFAYAAASSPGLIPAAAIISTLVMSGSTIYALKSPLGSFSHWKSGLYGGLIGMVGLNVLSLASWAMIGPNILTLLAGKVSTYAGFGLFTLMQVFDTQEAVQEYQEGKRDSLDHIMGMFLNYINLFIRVLDMLLVKHPDDSADEQENTDNSSENFFGLFSGSSSSSSDGGDGGD